jgi:hypothetical protein
MGIYKKGPYYTECGEMTDGCWWQKVWCGIVCTSKGVCGILPQKMFCIFSPLGLNCEHFLKQIFGYTALHCALIDQIWSVKCTCMVCLCKYHNWVIQGVGSLLNLVGLEHFESLDHWKWHFQSLLFAICDYRNQNTKHGILVQKRFWPPPPLSLC